MVTKVISQDTKITCVTSFGWVLLSNLLNLAHYSDVFNDDNSADLQRSSSLELFSECTGF